MNEKFVGLNLRLPLELHTEFKHKATDLRVSMNFLLKKLVEFFLAHPDEVFKQIKEDMIDGDTNRAK